MLIAKILKNLRRRAPASAVSPTATSVDIELPLVISAPMPELTPQQRWDLVLSPAAHIWLMTLPSLTRPRHLADQFPRIANRLALVWRDGRLVDKVLNDLLVDQRGGRRGFPPAVSAELLRLQAFHERHRQDWPTTVVEPRGKVWDLQASTDR